MKIEFSTKWKASKQPRKQRKYRYNAPKHIRGKFLHSHLSKELMKKHKKRSIRVRTGDKIKIMRGSFKGKTGKVERVNMKDLKIYLENVETLKKDGTKVKVGIDPSNILITELNLDDKKRIKKTGGESKNA